MILQIILGRCEGQISDEEFGRHISFSIYLSRSGPVNVPVLRSQIVCYYSTKDNFRITESLLLNGATLKPKSQNAQAIIDG